MTPNGIEVLIHCHVCPLPHPRRDAPAVEEELRSLKLNGLIEERPGTNDVFITTARGRAHIEQLCSTPWPVQAWIGADGKRLGDEFGY